MTQPFERVAVIGLGLIGGSVALAARRRGVARRVVGVGRRRETALRAREKGIVDEAGTDASLLIPGADLVVLATPLDASIAGLRAAAPHLREGAIVTDVGSVKAELVDRLPALLPRGAVFVGAHPMAGSHQRGLEHAREDLFENAPCVVTPTPATPAWALTRVRGFWEGLGARVLERDPDRHDAEVAWASHVPHAVAFAFAAALADAPRGVRDVRGGGFRDFTRIAWADPELWAEILRANRKQVSGPLLEVSARLARLARLLEADDGEEALRFIAAAREALARHASDVRSGDDGPEIQSAERADGSERSDERDS